MYLPRQGHSRSLMPFLKVRV
uniref:Uncharacterized protein n=1 Tax=Anguilla anguilla TaxID=7936 RepID=A0A0E9V1W8_ANGAN